MANLPDAPTVLLANDRLSEAAIADLHAAIRRANAQVASWREGMPETTPALVIGILLAGERRIPQELLDLLTRFTAPVPLMLVTEDPLVRPVVSLQAGRVTLVGPPLSADRLFGQIRMLLSETGNGRAPGPVATAERLAPEFFACAMAYDPSSPKSPRLIDAPGGFTAVVSLSGAPVPDDAVSSALAVLQSDADDQARSRDLERIFGQGAGLVHLSPAAQEWLFYWPAAEAPLSLHSPLRLPGTCELQGLIAKAPGKLRRMAASAGDLIVALSSAKALPPREELSKVAAQGGAAALVELFCASAPQGDKNASPFDGVLAEVR